MNFDFLKIPGVFPCVGQFMGYRWFIFIVGLCFAFQPSFIHVKVGVFKSHSIYLHRSIQLLKNLCPNC